MTSKIDSPLTLKDTLELSTMPKLVIVSGMSGAGRTEAIHIFEDIGYYCVDNLPAQLIGELLNVVNLNGLDTQTSHVAVVCDARNRGYFSFLKDELNKLEKKKIDYNIIFLDASDDKLIARYKSSRRRHPMCSEGATIVQGIQKERNLVYELKENANLVIDTTNLLPQQLREKIQQNYSSGNTRRGLAVTVYSFGFKHGAAIDADLVMDVRFLPNPFYNDELRKLTGLDKQVRDFVLMRTETIEFQKRWQALLEFTMPYYINEGKQQLAIAIGCTGGQHRSVVLAEVTGDFLKSLGYRVSVAHRDLKLAEE